LHIVDAQIANHQGIYTCLVENSVGKARREFNVNILGKFALENTKKYNGI